MSNDLGEKVYVVRSSGIDLKQAQGLRQAEQWASKNVRGTYSIYSYFTGIVDNDKDKP